MGDLIHFDAASLIAGFIFGVIGWWMFKESRRRDNDKLTYIGIGLMLYPYFVDGAVKNWGIGVVLCLLAYHFWDG